MLFSGWCRVLELQQGSFDTVFHACFECSVIAVSLEIDSCMSGACPISLDGAMLFECICQVLSILLSLTAGSEVVDNKGKRNGSCFVEEKSWSMLGRAVAMLGKVLFELVVGKFA